MKKHGLGQAYWNAHQVYTWVYTRNPRLVVLLSDCDKGDSVEPSVIDFFAMSNRPGAEFADYAEAQEAIISTLQEGRLRSLGRREGVGTLEDIPTVEWVDLHFVWSVFHDSAEAVGMTDDPPASIVGAPRWYGLRFKRDDVLELWPPTETEPVLIGQSSIDTLLDGDSDDPSQSPEAISDGATLAKEQEDAPAQTLPPHDEPDPQEPAETPSPAQATPAEPSDKQERPQRNRNRDVEADAQRKASYELVVAIARRKWPDPKKRPEIDVMAKELARVHSKELRYKFETIRKILKGTYKTSKRLGIDGL